MYLQDIFLVAKWWVMLLAIGVIFLPFASSIFSGFFDKGYIFSKILGFAIISYLIFVLGIFHILPFTQLNIILVLIFFSILNIVLSFSSLLKNNLFQILKQKWMIFLIEELIFLSALVFWSYIRGFQPDIHGLEKFEDFGFINSIMRSEYFPPADMWFTPFSINYYYFGHIVTAVLTKVSSIPSSITFNLMLSTIFAFTFAGVFSIGANLLYSKFKSEKLKVKSAIQNSKQKKYFCHSIFENLNLFRASNFDIRILFGGLLTAFLVTFAGNLHTVYTFFKPYVNENPVPFWQLQFSLGTFPNSYWYPNATRFIYNTIHEFPIYSFVVSDLHGHVLDIPFVLLTIAVLFSLISKSEIPASTGDERNPKQIRNSNVKNSKNFGHSLFGNLNLFRVSIFDIRILLLAFLLAIMYMTNAWDAVTYFLLSALVLIVYFKLKPVKGTPNPRYIKNTLVCLTAILIGFFIFSLPLNLNFKPFASGIGILCAPSFLSDVGKIGPFLFEAEHCQRSPLWQLLILYGFFYFWVISFIVYIRMHANKRMMNPSDLFVLILILLSTLLIVIPEFVYIKDIYPAHYRANTMFKFVFQAFIILSISSAYIITRMMPNIKRKAFKIFNFYYIYLLFATSFLILVMVYPYFAINSYYGNLKEYKGLEGTSYLGILYPNDYQAILWINQNIKGQPVILEAQGDSYSDYARVSSNTGLPTVLGWTVHEWLWRGTYDVPAPRIPEVQTLYESKDINITKNLINKYNVSYIFVGDLERQKYANLFEEKFNTLGKTVFESGKTKIYQLDRGS